MGDNVLKLTTELSTKGVEKGFEAIKKGTLSTAKAVNKAIDGITSVFKKVLSLAAIKKVFDQFKQYLDSSLKKNQEYAASMRALKGSIAAAFQPIYEIAAPAIIHLVQLLNMVIQAIGRFIAALSGKSYSQMLKNAQALSKQKDLLNGVGGAAKDAARQLMSFDEINRLEDNSGGGGSGMTFNEVNLGSATGAIDDFASKLRELLQNGQFEDAGELIAQNVNKMLEAFDVEKLGSTVGKWTTNFADFLNGLIFNIDWNLIGGKLANGIDSLLANVDGQKIGKLLTAKFSIAIRMISGFFKELNGGQVGATLGDAILGFAQSLGEDISTNFDAEFWDKLNQNISDGFDAFVPKFIGALKVAVDTVIKQAPKVIGTLGNIGLQVVNTISEALSSMDEEIPLFDDRGFQLNATQTRWQALGASVAEGFGKIDWAGILTGSIASIGKLTNGLLEFISSAIDGIGGKWEEIGAAVGEGFNQIPWSKILEKGLVALGNLAIGLCKLLTGAINKIEEDGGWNEVGAAIIDGLASIDWMGLNDAIDKFMRALRDALLEMIFGAVDEVTEGTIFETHLVDRYKEKLKEADELARKGLGVSAEQFSENPGMAEKARSYYGTADYSDGSHSGVSGSFSKESSDVADKWDNAARTFDDATKSVDEYIAHFDELLSGERTLSDVIKETVWLGQNGVSGDDLVAGLGRAFGQSDSQYSAALETFKPYIDALNEAAEKADASKSATDRYATAADDAKESTDAVTDSLDSVSESAKDTADQVATSAADAEASVNDSSAKAASALGTVNVAAEVLVGTAYRLAAAVDSIQFGELGASMRHGSIAGLGAAATFGNLFHAAEGAVIPPNREFMAVFGDQRSGTNIEAPESLIRQIVREEAGSSGGSGRLESLMEELIGTVGNIRVGDDTIGRAAARYTRTHGRAVGG